MAIDKREPVVGVFDFDTALIENGPDEIDVGWIAITLDLDEDDLLETADWYEPDQTLMGVVGTSYEDPDALFRHEGPLGQVAYKADPNAEFTAILNHEERTVQVVQSKWVCDGVPASPCYPDQGTPSETGGFEIWSLPPDMWASNGVSVRPWDGVPVEYWTKHHNDVWIKCTRDAWILEPRYWLVLKRVFARAKIRTHIRPREELPMDHVQLGGSVSYRVDLPTAFLWFYQGD